MIDYENGLLERIQDAVCDFVTETDQNDFSITVKITVDDGNVFMPKVVKEGGDK